MTSDPQLPAQALADLGAIRYSEVSMEEMLTRVAAIARANIDGADEVSVSLLTADGAKTVASTGAMAVLADGAQYALGHGPCLEAAESGSTRIVADLTTDERWPDYSRAAVEAGVVSSISVGLPVQNAATAAINVYSRTPNAFDENAVARAEGFAPYAAIAVANAHQYLSAAELAEHMRNAMASRATIEQAKGILIALHGCDEDAAFDLLTRESQRRHRKLRDVAREIVTRAQAASSADQP